MRKTERVSNRSNRGINYTLIENEYYCNNCAETYTNAIEVIKSLSDTDRTIIIMYAELKSMDKIARLFNCSKSTIWNRIRDIREKISKKIDYA